MNDRTKKLARLAFDKSAAEGEAINAFLMLRKIDGVLDMILGTGKASATGGIDFSGGFNGDEFAKAWSDIFKSSGYANGGMNGPYTDKDVERDYYGNPVKEKTKSQAAWEASHKPHYSHYNHSWGLGDAAIDYKNFSRKWQGTVSDEILKKLIKEVAGWEGWGFLPWYRITAEQIDSTHHKFTLRVGVGSAEKLREFEDWLTHLFKWFKHSG